MRDRSGRSGRRRGSQKPGTAASRGAAAPSCATVAEGPAKIDSNTARTTVNAADTVLDIAILDAMIPYLTDDFLCAIMASKAGEAVMAKQTMQMNTKAFDKLFPNEEACDAFLIARRWPTGARCPRCGSERVYPLQTLKNKWECPDCREGGAYRFSHLVGTIFENTNLDLSDWFKVIHLMLTSKKGISARQIHRYMGFGATRRLGMFATASAPRCRTRISASLWASLRLMKPISAANRAKASRRSTGALPRKRQSSVPSRARATWSPA